MRTTRGGWHLAAALLLAACGGGDSAPHDAVPSGDEHVVVIRMTDEMRFVPEHPVVSVGDTIVWVNEGQMPHTSTDTPGTAGVAEHNVLPPDAGPWDSGLLDPGEQFRYVVTTPGEYTYLCFLHEAAGMVGRLTVK